MPRLIFLACALIASTICAARPTIIHRSQTLLPPAGYAYFGYEVAIDGDWAIIAAATRDASTAQPEQTHDALLYHLVNGQWTLDRTLVHRTQTASGPLVYFKSVAMSNGLAAIGSNPTHIFKRTNNTWTEIAHPFTAPQGDPDWVSGDLHWDGNTLLATRSVCVPSQPQPWGALISRLNSDGSWSPLQRLSGGHSPCNESPRSWGISGDTVIASALSSDYETANQLYIFRRSGSAWTQTGIIHSGDGEGDVRGNEIFVPNNARMGTAVYRNDDSLTILDVIRTVSASYDTSWRAFNLTHTDDVFVQEEDVFRKNADGKYEHVAVLKPRGPYASVHAPKVNGRRAIAYVSRNFDSSNPAVVIFDLPATYSPSRVIATGFENGSPPFSPQIGSFAVVQKSNGNHVYRQSSLIGEYRALLGNSDWEEQSIEATIKPTASSGWTGLAVRHLDDANYYAVALHSSGRVELRVMRNGALTTLTQKAFPIVAGRAYHVALQAYATWITVNIDGRAFLRWQDSKPVPHGSAALLGEQATADYDNVVAAQAGQRPIFDLSYSDCNGLIAYAPAWKTSGAGNWNCTSETGAYTMQQRSTAGDARAIVGTPTDDQVVTTRARATAFADSKDRWFGVAARYVDESNYYFLTVRNSNTVSLRKIVNGTVTVLGTVTLTVRPNTWYTLRLDAVGNELRGFINGAQILQATDGSHPRGQNGIVTYKTAAEYTNYFAWQP